VHRTTLSLGDTAFTAQKFSNDALDRSTTNVSETVASVSSDDLITVGDGRLHTNRNGFLFIQNEFFFFTLVHNSRNIPFPFSFLFSFERDVTYLTSAQVAETANLLGLVKGISSHLHSAHGDHLCVHVNHILLGELKLQRRLLKFVNLKGRLWESDLDFLRSIRGRSKEAGSSGREGTLAKEEEGIRRL
jgi:hypothetical protein